MDAFLGENGLAWFLTCVIESGIWMMWLRRQPTRVFVAGVVVNSLTQPVAVLTYHRWLLSLTEYRGGHVPEVLLVIECVVVLIEWPLIRGFLRVHWSKALWISLTANAVTTLLSFCF